MRTADELSRLDAPVCDVCKRVVTEVGRWRHRGCPPPKPPLRWCRECGRLCSEQHFERECAGRTPRTPLRAVK